MTEKTTLVIGQGEIGTPIAKILENKYKTSTKDLADIQNPGPVSVLHICYPFQIQNFIDVSLEYIEIYSPDLTIIHSTVIPGTTDLLSSKTNSPIIYSPVRGKHSTMETELLSLRKYMASTDTKALNFAKKYMEDTGFTIELFTTPSSLELAKILETSYFGLLIGWAQEMERYTKSVDGNYEEIMKFALEDDISYMPKVIFQPGFIGGHCVMPNIELLETLKKSSFLDAIKESNSLKQKEWIETGKNLDQRLGPSPLENPTAE